MLPGGDAVGQRLPAWAIDTDADDGCRALATVHKKYLTLSKPGCILWCKFVPGYLQHSANFRASLFIPPSTVRQILVRNRLEK